MSITDRQRAEAEEHRPDDHGPDVCGDPECFPSCLECGQDWPCATAALLAEWAASLPPTDEEVQAGAEALWMLDHPESPFDSLADSARENPKMAAFYRRLAHAALTAAREAQR